MYPTKALAQDQLGSLRRFTVSRDWPLSPTTATYPSQPTQSGEASANVILTNPDMLHYGILPNHRLWESFLSRLDHVVIDEMHYLRGVFGSHSARIIHRLRRLAAHYGSNPTSRPDIGHNRESRRVGAQPHRVGGEPGGGRRFSCGGEARSRVEPPAGGSRIRCPAISDLRSVTPLRRPGAPGRSTPSSSDGAARRPN